MLGSFLRGSSIQLPYPIMDFNELQEQYAELEAALEKCKMQNAECKIKGENSGEKVWERVFGIMRCEHDEDIREIERLKRYADETDAECEELRARLEATAKPASESKKVKKARHPRFALPMWCFWLGTGKYRARRRVKEF